MAFFGIFCGIIFGVITATIGLFVYDMSILMALLAYSVSSATTGLLVTFALYRLLGQDDQDDDQDGGYKDDSMEPLSAMPFHTAAA